MTGSGLTPLLVGEVFVDFTITAPGQENKLRLGGITHAARGFWANNMPYAVAAILPQYLEESARRYFTAFGCNSFDVVGYVNGAPNVITVLDATEVGDQGYEDLLRDEKSINPTGIDLTGRGHANILVFPGKYDLLNVLRWLPASAKLHLDVAYDLDSPDLLAKVAQPIGTILMSTSSPLFQSFTDGPAAALAQTFGRFTPDTIVFKENRGGSRIFDGAGSEIERLPAQLGTTVNSVGVGDVFAATYVTHIADPVEAGWRATYAAAAYSQTTEPDLFKQYVERAHRLSVDDMRGLSGVQLPWEARPALQIYLASPDFVGADRRDIDAAIGALKYHNFTVRRPVIENGELPVGSDLPTLRNTYAADYRLLKECALVFAVPTGRDPGTLVEVGIALEACIPVVVFDPRRENANTMVIAGANHYSGDLDACLNAVFDILSRRRA